MNLTPKEKALGLRNQFRLFVGVGTDADNELQNNYLVSKHVAKRSALLCVEHLADAATSTETKNYLCAVKVELKKL
jgi:hypothetical protein